MNFLLFASVHILAILSPGQVFVGITSIALKYGFRPALLFVLGVLFGNFIFAIISVFGLTEVIFKSFYFTLCFYTFSGLYLAFIGVKLLREKEYKIGKDEKISKSKSILLGFLTDISNPKSAFFATTLAAIVITPESSLQFKIFIIFWMTFVSFFYEALIAFIISVYREKILKYIKQLNRFFGVIMIIFSARLLFLGAKMLV